MKFIQILVVDFTHISRQLLLRVSSVLVYVSNCQFFFISLQWIVVDVKFVLLRISSGISPHRSAAPFDQEGYDETEAKPFEIVNI